MAIGWLTILKSVPWTEVIKNAPKVAEGARKLWNAVGRQRAAGEVTTAEVAQLVPLIREVLQEAISAGGSSLRDYRQTDGELGYFQHAFRVYDRSGDSCATEGCPGTIGRIVQGGRSSFFCPCCQR